MAAAVAAAPKGSNALEPAGDSAFEDKKPADLMTELMSAMMTLQDQNKDGDSGAGGLSELTQFMGVATDLLNEAQKGDLNDPAHMQSMMIKAALQLGKASGGDEATSLLTDTLLNPTTLSSLMQGDPTAAMGSLVDSMLEKTGTPKDDPLVKLAKSGAKMLVNGEAAPDDNPFTHLHDVVTQGQDSHELAANNPFMELILDTIKAASNDQSGDPLNAMAEYVLEHPKAAANPIVANAKTIHRVITDPDEHHKSPIITAAKTVAETLSTPDLHETSPILKLIADTIANPHEMAKDSPLIAAAQGIQEHVLNKGGPEEHVTDLISTFTKKVASGGLEDLSVEGLLDAHPAGSAVKNAAGVLADVVENAHATDDAVVKLGREIAETVTTHHAETDDPLIKAAQTAHKTLTNPDSADPLIEAAKNIHEHVMTGIEDTVSKF